MYQTSIYISTYNFKSNMNYGNNTEILPLSVFWFPACEHVEAVLFEGRTEQNGVKQDIL